MSIEARFVLKRAPLERNDFALNVDLKIPEHGITAIFGRSGCGKTTLLRAIAGLEKAQTGYFKIGDQVWQNEQLFLPPHKRAIGYVFQEASLFDHLSIQKNLQYGLKRLTKKSRNTSKASLGNAIALLGIGHLLQRKPYQLSGGEQQRVAIARALAVNPALLLMDEPLAALDMSLKQEILPYLETLHQELDIPVLYVTHSRHEIALLANYLVLLDAGQVQATGTLKEVFSRLDLPLAHQLDTETVIQGTIAEHDDQFQLSYLDFAGGRFTIARNNLKIGSKARLQVLARDVSITLERQQNTSILNIFPAIIKQIADNGKSQTTVKLMLGDCPLLSRITRKSAIDLALKPNKDVFVQVKSVALLKDIID